MSIIDLKKQVNILDYASYIGFHPYKVGKWYSLKEHDSVRIDPVKNLFYRNSTGDSGSVIDFVMAFTGKELGDAIKELEAFSGSDREVLASCLYHEELHSKEAAFTLPEKAESYKNIYAYLIKTRGIKKEIVDYMVKHKHLYQDIHNNCVFVSYREGEPVFASLRGTNTEKRFVADVSGSDYSYGLFFEGDKRGVGLLITESVIDLLSLMTLNSLFTEKKLAVLKDESNGNPFGFTADFLSLSGVGKTEPVLRHLREHNYRWIALALDNDDAGRAAAEKITKEILDNELLEENQIVVMFPREKDWNEDLLILKS